ncbi:hypothetical protein D9619_000292 [Psilocybe cf. subviscida]|uniref:DUF7962 domain-containing protein n=1 Tax=Psilocybe cf. subviscida TaxID=2480587 RepID=A0A8H5BGR0_9AGAR|nr:hypothetical protein D9619_000292 [Psilocybe cf. subviscida]
MLPRPEITDLLGVKYRRIPVLAVGNDVYCDSNIIITVLERRFPASKGYGTVFPTSEDALFTPVLGLLPWTSGFPDEFMKDRGELRGAPIDAQAFADYSPVAISTLSTHLSLIEEQLADGRKYLFRTSGPSLADIAVYFILNWARVLPGGGQLIDAEPAIKKWIDRINEEISELRKLIPEPTELTGVDAADAIKGAEHEPYGQVGFDAIEASRLGMHKGMEVKVTPEDTGRAHPTFGTLVALGKHEITIEVTPKGDGDAANHRVVRVHFPRLAFSIRSPDALVLLHLVRHSKCIHGIFADDDNLDIQSLAPQDLIEEQLSDGRKYLFTTTEPSLADIIFQWLERITAHLEVLRVAIPPPQELPGSQAAEVIIAADYEPLEVVGFDDVESERLGVKRGMEINVVPDDTARLWQPFTSTKKAGPPTCHHQGNLRALASIALLARMKILFS